jgi:serine/threonine protein kinase
MLTGKPPFQSATADEIYRRAREREYDWPKLDTSENFISQETKDLVSELLQPPEQRPDPDTIVQHPFFTCGWMPQSEEMTPALRDKHPDPNQFLSVGARGGRTNLYLRNLKKLCIKCEVGPWNTSLSGYISTYRECADEEKAGLTPKVPLPEDVVYRPFHEWLEEQATPLKPIAQRSSSSAMEGVLPSAPSSRSENLPLPSHTRPTTQSFAAQQRARPQASAANPPSRTIKPRQLSSESSARSGNTIPNRSAKSHSRKVESQTSEDAADVENRLAVDLVQQLNAAEIERKSLDADAPTISLGICESLFNPKEKLESLPNTKPDHILEGLRRLQAELERALNARTMSIETKKTPSLPTIVVKWVDYTNKFGLGYILSNGSVGCIFKATPADSEDPSKGLIPPCCVVVRDAERHLQNRANEAYVDRYQIVPISGPNIEFYENRGEKGVFRGKVNPQNYKVQVNLEGEALRLARGKDDWDNRKREKIMLWKKFANYMTAYGRDQDYPFDDALARTQNQAEFVVAGNVVTFYQRWGDVGCWFFADGHFQVCPAGFVS